MGFIGFISENFEYQALVFLPGQGWKSLLCGGVVSWQLQYRRMFWLYCSSLFYSAPWAHPSDVALFPVMLIKKKEQGCPAWKKPDRGLKICDNSRNVQMSPWKIATQSDHCFPSHSLQNTVHITGNSATLQEETVVADFWWTFGVSMFVTGQCMWVYLNSNRYTNFGTCSSKEYGHLLKCMQCMHC